MDYERATVVITMTAPEFEAVFDVLQDFCRASDEGRFNNLSKDERTRIRDKVTTIRKLDIKFVEGE